MTRITAKLMAGAALAGLLLAGCGGSSDGGGVFGGPPPAANQTISDVFAYVNQLIATTDANSDPIDIDGLTLATDETSEPAVLN